MAVVGAQRYSHLGIDLHMPVDGQFHTAKRSTQPAVDGETTEHIASFHIQNGRGNTSDVSLCAIETALSEHYSAARARELKLMLHTKASKTTAQQRHEPKQTNHTVQMGEYLQGLVTETKEERCGDRTAEEGNTEVQTIVDHLEAVRTAAQVRKAYKAESYEALSARQKPVEPERNCWASPLLEASNPNRKNTECLLL